MEPRINGFDYQRVTVADGVTLTAAVGGSGPPIVLLHGFPQTHLTWRHVAADLAADHPAAISHLALLDVLPTLDMWDVLHGLNAAVAFHLYLMAQPPGLPEELIGGSPDAFFGHFLDVWTRDPGALPAEVRATYLRASRDAVTSIVADYRASAGIDVTHDTADRAAGNKLRMPVTVLQQDWGAARGYDAAGVWRAWAPDLDHQTATCGHFMAEEAPATVVGALRALLQR
ncbi:alpha/beta hydrolase [Micromonospora sp. NPDC049230]|uniref:alpha/beta fold hydrolase n=1 Tax=Micromonospora sp. NPDC049230 TaxID=3155502 RepID=UPI0033EDF9DA